MQVFNKPPVQYILLYLNTLFREKNLNTVFSKFFSSFYLVKIEITIHYLAYYLTD